MEICRWFFWSFDLVFRYRVPDKAGGLEEFPALSGGEFGGDGAAEVGGEAGGV